MPASPNADIVCNKSLKLILKSSSLAMGSDLKYTKIVNGRNNKENIKNNISSYNIDKWVAIDAAILL